MYSSAINEQDAAAQGDAVGQALCVAAIVRSHFFESFAVESMQSWMPRFEALLTRIQSFALPAVELTVYSSFQFGAIFTAPELPSLHQSAFELTNKAFAK